MMIPLLYPVEQDAIEVIDVHDARIRTGGLEIFQPKDAAVPANSPLEEGSRDFVPEIRSQALLAIEEADVIVLVVDAVQGITAADEEIAEILRRTSKPVMVAANKADNTSRQHDAFEFFGLGLGDVYAISALHGTGTGDLLDAIVEALPHAPGEDYDAEDDTIKIAIVGRPNVGKSSLLNKLIGQGQGHEAFLRYQNRGSSPLLWILQASPKAAQEANSCPLQYPYSIQPCVLLYSAKFVELCPAIRPYNRYQQVPTHP